MFNLATMHPRYVCLAMNRIARVARVRAIVKKLRRKLGDAAPGRGWVLNEYGVGYRMPGPGES